MISRILSRNVPMAALNASEETEYDRTTICANCKRSFTDDNQKTRHHNHVTGKYLFPACNSCNLVLKPRKCKIVTTQSNSTKVIGCDDDNGNDDDGVSGGDSDGGEWTYLVPIVFHNLLSYDGHFVLQFFCKEYTEYTARMGTKAYADVGVIPLNGERNMLLKIGNIVFVDSCQFLATSLDNLVKALRKSSSISSRTQSDISAVKTMPTPRRAAIRTSTLRTR